ncbi:MAG: NADH-quinone oxidoreductase subunit C [Bacteroidetes bacterium]|nr:NADH-quinone oxidoreductase subunit C [Bacteroidota bacterium]
MDVIQRISNELVNTGISKTEYAGEVTLHVPESRLYDFLKNLKENYGFDYLVDVVATDHYRDEFRFEIGYNLVNLTENKRLRVKAVLASEEKPEVESVVSLWPAANWYEREQFDMMGIGFRNHPDLRRIYMPEDFEYFPLRKEFPLIGIPGSIQMPEKDAPKGYK